MEKEVTEDSSSGLETTMRTEGSKLTDWAEGYTGGQKSESSRGGGLVQSVGSYTDNE